MSLLHRPTRAPVPAGLPAYVAWVDQQIGRVIVAEHLHAALLKVVEGPAVLSFTLRLTRDATRANISRLLSLAAAFAHALHVPADAVRLIGDNDGILLQIPHPSPWTPTIAQLAAYPQPPDRPIIGLDAARQPVAWNLSASPHLLAVGPTQRGKTEAVKTILALLSRSHRPGAFAFIILAKKTASWLALARTASCVALITDPAEQQAYTRWLAARLDERTAANHTDPVLITVLDDAHDLVSTADIIAPLQRVAGLGAAVNLYIFATTQTTGRRGGVGDLEHNFATRLVFGAADASAAARFAGSANTGADRVGRTKGDALLIIDGQPQRVATARCDDAWLLSALPPRSAADWPIPWRTTQHHPAPPGTGAEPITDPYPDLASSGAERGYPSLNTGAAPVPAPPGTGRGEVSSPVPFLLADHLPTADEIDRIRAARATIGSLNQTCVATYGSKNPRRAAFVKWACGDDLTDADRYQLAPFLPGESTMPLSPAILDLEDPADRHALDQLLSAGAPRFVGRSVR